MRLNEEARTSEERRSNELQSFLKKSDQEKKDLQKRLDDKESRLSGQFVLDVMDWLEVCVMED